MRRFLSILAGQKLHNVIHKKLNGIYELQHSPSLQNGLEVCLLTKQIASWYFILFWIEIYIRLFLPFRQEKGHIGSVPYGKENVHHTFVKELYHGKIDQ